MLYPPDNVHIISLSRRKDRRDAIRAANPKLADRLHFFEAVDGKKITVSHSQTKPGRMGCFLSHLYLWRKLLQTQLKRDEDWAVVAEDDASIRFTMLQDFWPKLVKYGDDRKLDVMFLDWNASTEPKPESSSYNGFTKRIFFNKKLKSYSWSSILGLQLYMINKKGAQKLATILSSPYEISDPLDIVIGKLGKKKEVNLEFVGSPTFGVFAKLAKGVGSDTENLDAKRIFSTPVTLLIVAVLAVLLFCLLFFYRRHVVNTSNRHPSFTLAHHRR